MTLAVPSKEQFKPAALNFAAGLNSLYSYSLDSFQVLVFFSSFFSLSQPFSSAPKAVRCAVLRPFSDPLIEPHNSLGQITAASGIISLAEYLHWRDNYLSVWLLDGKILFFFFATKANASIIFFFLPLRANQS